MYLLLCLTIAPSLIVCTGGYDHRGVALSAGVQRMVRSDLASSGVMFSIDTESGFGPVVFITSAWGRWEMVGAGCG